MSRLNLVMPMLRRARDGVNPALRFGLGRVPRRRWPGAVMNLLGCGAPIMVGKGETVVVCGVFQPTTVRDFSLAVGADGRVVVIEANPHNVERLRVEAALPNVTVENRAVWSEDVDLELEFADEGAAQHYNRVRHGSLQPFPTHMVADVQSTLVRGERLTTTMDRVGIARADHLNLTVNGAEYAAFHGDAGTDLAPRVGRVYTHTEFPDPGRKLEARLRLLGFHTRVSARLKSRNELIDLRRLYAWRT